MKKIMLTAMVFFLNFLLYAQVPNHWKGDSLKTNKINELQPINTRESLNLKIMRVRTK